MTEFLPFNGRPLRTFKNYSGTRADKITWIGTGGCKLFKDLILTGKYPENIELFALQNREGLILIN